MHLNQFEFFFSRLSSVVIVILFLPNNSYCKEIQVTTGTETTDTVSRVSKSQNCVYDDGDLEVQENPWTATLEVRIVGKGSAVANDYYTCAILSEYTVLTYGRPFNLPSDKLAFLPWSNYSVLIGAVKNGTNVTFSQSLEVASIQPHPYYARKSNYQLWMFAQNDSLVIQLKSPIKFDGISVRPVCLPESANIYDNDGSNKTVIVGGWKRYLDLEKTSLTVQLRTYDECEKEWRTRTRTTEEELPYATAQRVCGYTTLPNQNNPDAVCIVKDSGAMINHGNEYFFMGFVNTFYSSPAGGCKAGAYYQIYKLSPWTLNWLNDTLRCGPSQYTCHNGECAPLDLLCNQKKDSCSDGSDEDPKYCRALNPCDVEQFECGVYGQCIPKIAGDKSAQSCDGVKDCPLGEDEESCEELNSGIPARKVISSVAIGLSILILLLVPAAILIWRKFKRAKGWKLTDDVISEFLDGSEVSAESEIEIVTNKPYDSAAYEIPIEHIEKGEQIGSGTFGDVFKGTVVPKDSDKRKDCAIKIPKPNADPEQIKGFLKELKIMAHVGRHENIANFIGAYTRKLKDGILYIVVEFCEHKSLEDYFKSNKMFFNNQLKNPRENNSPSIPAPVQGYVEVEVHAFSTTDLIQWSSQVASAMAHLASKHVIHGDLAARNILLDSNRVAKICDFGLSHHLYTNMTYLASAEARLPWKWMAVETLLQRTLSTKSDVWSFGVTLWEIFSLGAEPYEALEWNPSFAYSLSISGCELGQPEFANAEIFQIMRKCWEVNPDLRPDFSELEARLNGVGLPHMSRVESEA